MKRYIGIILVGCLIILGIGLHYMKPLWTSYTEFSLHTISGDPQYMTNKSIRGDIVKPNEYSDTGFLLTLDGTEYYNKLGGYWEMLGPFRNRSNDNSIKRIYDEHRTLFRGMQNGFGAGNLFEDDAYVVLTDINNKYISNNRMEATVKVSVKDKQNDHIWRYTKTLSVMNESGYVFHNQMQIIDGEISLFVTQHGQGKKSYQQYMLPLRDDNRTLEAREIDPSKIFTAQEGNVSYEMFGMNDLDETFSPYILFIKQTNDHIQETPTVSYNVERIRDRQYARVNLQDGTNEILDNESLVTFVSEVKEGEYLQSKMEHNKLVLLHESKEGAQRVFTYDMQTQAVEQYDVDYRSKSATIRDGKLYLIPIGDNGQNKREVMVVDYQTSELLYHGEIVMKQGDQQDMDHMVIYSVIE